MRDFARRGDKRFFSASHFDFLVVRPRLHRGRYVLQVAGCRLKNRLLSPSEST